MKQRSTAPEQPAEIPPDGGVLARLFVAHEGRVCDKWEHYLAVYEWALAGFMARRQPVRLLEIGVQNGGSLEIWAKYLPAGSTVIGIDIDPACADLAVSPNISVRIGDASDRAALDRMLGEDRFDVVIDDGSHRSEHVVATFEACFARLDPGGVYLVEDAHCSYWELHGGGFRRTGTSIEHFKELADALNADHFAEDAAASLDEGRLERLRRLGREIARLTFFDSVVVVEKLPTKKRQPYRRIITGRATPVYDIAREATAFPAAQLRTLLLPPHTAAEFAPTLLGFVASAREEVGRLQSALSARDERVAEITRAAAEYADQAETRIAGLSGKIASLDTALAERDRRVSELDRMLSERDRRLSEFAARESGLEERLAALYRSTSWRLTAPLRHGVTGARGAWAATRGALLLGPSLAARSLRVIREHGFREFAARARRFTQIHWSRRTARLRLRRAASQPGWAARLRTAAPHPVVSFVIPVHNRTDMLRTAIRSALDQTFPAIEVVVVTNGSPPETLAVLDEFCSDPRVRVFSYYRDDTGNAVRGRNKGILEARGDYIAFLDSDDIAEPTRAADSLPLLSEAKADVVYGAWQVMMDGTRLIDGLANGQIVHSPDCDLAMLCETNVPYQSTVMARKSLFATAGFLKPQMQYREDHELWARLAFHGAVFRSVPRVLTRIRVHGGNTELNFKGNDAHWKEMMAAEYRKPGPRPRKIAFLLGGLGINGGTAVVFRHIMMLLRAGHDAFAINLGEAGDGGAWFTGNTAPIVHISDKRRYLFDNIDLLFATGWMTVGSLPLVAARRKLYFVQADERQFVDEPAERARVHEEYKTRCEYLTEARWIQEMLRREFGHQAAYVPNGIDPEVFYPDAPLEPKNPKRLRVLIEGPICLPRKGMDDAHAAIAPLDCEIWIVSSAGLPKRGWRYDRFFEGVPFGEMRRVYSACDIFLKMSRVEGFFGPPMEAMACGCAVVVGKVSGYDEYIVHEENALVVEQGDVAGARQAVARLLDNAALREKLVERGFETAKSWTWETSAKAMLALVESDRPESPAPIAIAAPQAALAPAS